MRAVPTTYGDLMTLSQFQEAVKSACFIDYDGYGYYATEHEMDESHVVSPSHVFRGEKAPEWVTHVMWFNR